MQEAVVALLHALPPGAGDKVTIALIVIACVPKAGERILTFLQGAVDLLHTLIHIRKQRPMKRCLPRRTESQKGDNDA